MARCEDYPCCGHESGDCPQPDSQGRPRWKCVECGKRLSLKASSSICTSCMRQAEGRFARGEDMFPERN